MSLKEILNEENLGSQSLDTKLEVFLNGITSNFNIVIDKNIDALDISDDLKLKFINKIKSSNFSHLILKSKLATNINDHDLGFKFAFSAFSHTQNIQTFEVYANALFDQINESLCKDDFKAADKQMDDLKLLINNNSDLDHTLVFNNAREALVATVKSYKALHKKILKYSNEIEKERWKSIEIIAIFSSILSFVLVSINLIQKTTADEAMELMVIFTLLITTFPLSISLLIDNTLQDKRLRFLFLILLLSILSLIFVTKNS